MYPDITLPLVKPALVVAVLFRALDALRMFDLPYILIGPRKGTVETLSMLVQDEASNLRYGSAAAYCKATGGLNGVQVDSYREAGEGLPRKSCSGAPSTQVFGD